MTTTKEQFDEIASYLEPFGAVRGRPMMGEYLIYLDDTHLGGIYDGQLLLKITSENQKFKLPEVLPYPSAKRTMYCVNDLFDQPELAEVILATRDSLANK